MTMTNIQIRYKEWRTLQRLRSVDLDPVFFAEMVYFTVNAKRWDMIKLNMKGVASTASEFEI